jgi:hypothetical protein
MIRSFSTGEIALAVDFEIFALNSREARPFNIGVSFIGFAMIHTDVAIVR